MLAFISSRLRLVVIVEKPDVKLEAATTEMRVVCASPLIMLGGRADGVGEMLISELEVGIAELEPKSRDDEELLEELLCGELDGV